MTVSSPSAAVPNHHADHPGFSGIGGLVAGLTMIIGRGRVARLAADLAAVTSTDHVVDVGCGPGVAAREASRRGARVTGIDPASVMLKLARALTRRRRSISWTDGVAEALPLPDCSATVVWSISTVHHWRAVDDGVAEARRVLVQGGRLVAIERRTQPGATGMRSHGWTDAQADAFAERCRAAGFGEVRVTHHGRARRALLVVLASRT